MFARTAGADHHVGILVQGHRAQIGEALRRIGAIGVGKGQQLAARAREARLDGGTVAAIVCMANKPHVGVRSHDLRRSVVRAVVDDDDLEFGDADHTQRSTLCLDPFDDGGDPVLLVQRRDNHR